jgi:hypothetical protein
MAMTEGLMVRKSLLGSAEAVRETGGADAVCGALSFGGEGAAMTTMSGASVFAAEAAGAVAGAGSPTAIIEGPSFSVIGLSVTKDEAEAVPAAAHVTIKAAASTPAERNDLMP